MTKTFLMTGAALMALTAGAALAEGETVGF